jgi:hypothetical protein
MALGNQPVHGERNFAGIAGNTVRPQTEEVSIDRPPALLSIQPFGHNSPGPPDAAGRQIGRQFKTWHNGICPPVRIFGVCILHAVCPGFLSHYRLQTWSFQKSSEEH